MTVTLYGGPLDGLSVEGLKDGLNRLKLTRRKYDMDAETLAHYWDMGGTDDRRSGECVYERNSPTSASYVYGSQQ